MNTVPSPTEARERHAMTARKLASAVTEMVIRYGQAMSDEAYAYSRYLDTYDDADHARRERFRRAARRRFMCVQRLTNALRDLGGAS